MSEHDEIARRLRDEGQAQAPSDLRPTVMEQVRREQRRPAPRLALRRPVLVAAVAGVAALAAVTFGLTRGPSGGGRSASPGRSAAAARPASGNALYESVVSGVTASEARQVLGARYRPPVGGVVVAHVPRAQIAAYRRRLRAAANGALAAQSSPTTPGAASKKVTVRLVPLR